MTAADAPRERRPARWYAAFAVALVVNIWFAVWWLFPPRNVAVALGFALIAAFNAWVLWWFHQRRTGGDDA